jgi:thymidylate kinase
VLNPPSDEAGPVALPDGPTDVHPDLALAFQAAEDSGAAWAVLRGALDRPGGDVDVLVREVDLPRAISALTGVGFVLRRAPEHRPHRLLVRRTSAGDGWIVLDLVPVVETAGPRSRALPVLDDLLVRAELGADGVRRVSQADRDWLSLIRAVHRGPGSLTGVPPAESPLAAAVDVLLGPGEAAAAVAAARSAVDGDDAALRALLARWEPRLKAPAGRGARDVRRVRDALAWRSPGQPGVAVAVLGPDGAGKTTLVDGLAEHVPLAVSVRYLGVFRVNPDEPLWQRIPGVGLGLKLSTLRWRSVKAGVDQRRGRVVLYDRHVVDALLRPGRPTFRARVSYWLLLHSCPAPDVFVVLDAPGQLMFDRKGEHTPEILEERRQRYLELGSRFDNVEVVDATQDAASVRVAVEGLVWRTWSRAR